MIPSKRIIRLADQSVKKPCGELENVPIRVGSILAPCDFIILDVEEDQSTPIILGREALKTMGATINCKEDTLTCEVAGERAIFEFAKDQNRPMVERIWRIDLADKEAGAKDESMELRGEENLEGSRNEAQCSQAELYSIQNKLAEESFTPPPKVYENPLFSFSCDVVVLDGCSLGCKGYVGDDHTTTCEPQGRERPSLEGDVEKINPRTSGNGVTCAILDSKVVSPIHLVPRKGGMTCLFNEKGKFIFTRKVMGWRMVAK